MKEYNDFIEAYSKTRIVNGSKYERIVAIYNLMTEAQKASVEHYPIVPELNLSKTKGKVPTQAQFESWKDKSEFAIWIDGVHVPNTALNSYTADDIAYFTGSFVHKNARSESPHRPINLVFIPKKVSKDLWTVPGQ